MHMHGIDLIAICPGSVPVLVTLHLPLAWYSYGALDRRNGVHLYCVLSRRPGAAIL